MSRRSQRRTRGSNRERVRQKAHEHRQKISTYGLRLPDGVELWEPKQKGIYRIDVLPYEVTKSNHPDEIPVGEDWYRRLFRVHFGVGVDNRTILCPTSVGKPCPICEDVRKLKENWDKNKDLIKQLKPKEFVSFNIVDLDEDEDKIKVFAYSAFKFAELLEEELDEGEPENASFDNLEGGKTLKVRFSEEEFSGRSFLKATKIDFRDRDDYDESIMDEVVKLDEIIQPMSYEDIAKIYAGIDDIEDEEEPEETEPTEIPPETNEKPKKIKRTVKAKEDEPEQEEKPKKAKKQKVKKEPEPESEKPEEAEEVSGGNDDDDWGEDWD